jgi:hypothetical protein
MDYGNEITLLYSPEIGNRQASAIRNEREGWVKKQMPSLN